MIKQPIVRYTISHLFPYVYVDVAMYSIFRKKKLITGPKRTSYFFPRLKS